MIMVINPTFHTNSEFEEKVTDILYSYDIEDD